MRKRMLFICHGLGIGGIETCLVNLLNRLSDFEADVDVLLMNPIYDLKDRVVAENVHFIPEFDYVLNTTDVIPYIQNHGGIVHNMSLFFRYVIYRLVVKFRFTKPWMLFKALPTNYDVAVVYSKNGKNPFYAIDKVKAKKKILWNHEGLYEQSKKRYQLDKEYYPCFDKIVSVSTDAMNNICEYFPIREKSVVIKNIVDVRSIRSKATEFVPVSYLNDFINIVTVGRLVEEKRPDWAIGVCANLIKMGYKVKWHWVGDGNLKREVRGSILENDLIDNFILEGNQGNPYPFINYADIYVQSSRYEAYCTTITEAKVLYKPIITTDVGGMRDQIKDGITGIITEASVDSLTEALASMIDSKEERNRIISRLKEENYENSMKPYIDILFD